MLNKDLAKNLFNFLVKTKRYAKDQFTLPSDSPLTETQFKTLINLKKFKKITLKNLSTEINVSNSSLSIMLNKLVEDGWVNRSFDDNNRRITYFSLTEKGEAYIEDEIRKKIDELELKVSSLSMTDKVNLFDAIARIEDIVNKLS